MNRRIIAELTIPKAGSWDGRFTGSGNKYTKKLYGGNTIWSSRLGEYEYDFGDGWVAKVTIRYAKPGEKITNKFMGYGWMVDSIKNNSKITTGA